ncbi:unnamed protein product [Ectocarpus sp. CCAP 1310/34]|nr:unnamed protein product [Ectocarpus sp. CCAP 1310/34]
MLFPPSESSTTGGRSAPARRQNVRIRGQGNAHVYLCMGLAEQTSHYFRVGGRKTGYPSRGGVAKIGCTRWKDCQGRVARPPTKRRRPPLWSTAALILVAGGTTCLGLCLGFVLRGVRDERATALSLSRDAPAADPTAAADPAAAAAVATGGGVVKRYASFEEYAKEMFASGGGGSGRNRMLAVPVVDSPATVQSIGRSMALPLAIIIGVQKGGTQSLRHHLMTHPLLTGINGKEAHFFDRDPQR